MAIEYFPSVALSPDGSQLIYQAREGERTRLYSQALNRSETASQIRGTEGGHTPFFSPDGFWLGFLTQCWCV